MALAYLFHGAELHDALPDSDQGDGLQQSKRSQAVKNEREGKKGKGKRTQDGEKGRAMAASASWPWLGELARHAMEQGSRGRPAGRAS